MSKKQFIITLISASIIFLMGAMQFLPGPFCLAKLAVVTHSIILVSGIVCAMLTPIFLLLWVPLRKSDTNKASHYLMASILCLVCFLTFKSMIALGNFARNRAISNAKTLIADIEQYKVKHGSYPKDFNTMQYKPGIIGIPGYYYSLKADSYNINFCQHTLLVFNFEMVTYDPTGAREPEGDLPKTYDTPYQNWYYYIFD